MPNLRHGIWCYRGCAECEAEREALLRVAVMVRRYQQGGVRDLGEIDIALGKLYNVMEVAELDGYIDPEE